MVSNENSDLLDRVLTLRGHQITLRQAIADGMIKGYLGPDTGGTNVVKVDPNRFLGSLAQRRSV